MTIRDIVEYVREHHAWRLPRVMMVGAVGFIIAGTLFELLGIRLKFVSPSTATLIAGECAILSNFFLNNRFSFAEMAGLASSLPRRLLKFHLVSSGSLLTQWVFVFTGQQFTDEAMYLRLIWVLGVAVGFLFNYTGYYFWVWKKRQ